MDDRSLAQSDAWHQPASRVVTALLVIVATDQRADDVSHCVRKEQAATSNRMVGLNPHGAWLILRCYRQAFGRGSYCRRISRDAYLAVVSAFPNTLVDQGRLS